MSTRIYKAGETVPEDGKYACIACGNKMFFKAGGMFPICDECLAGSADGPAGFGESDVEFWKKSF